MSNDLEYQRAHNFKIHMKKLQEIRSSPTKRLDNHLPPIFFNVKKRQGYKALWWSHKINKENQQLLDKLIEIKMKKKTTPAFEKDLNLIEKNSADLTLVENDSSFIKKSDLSTISHKVISSSKKAKIGQKNMFKSPTIRNARVKLKKIEHKE